MKVATNVKFLWLELDKCMNWKNRIDKILPRMSSAGYAVRSMYYFSCVTRHMTFRFAYFHAVIQHGIISGGNLIENKGVFQLQKKIIKFTTISGSRNYCKLLLQTLEILTLPSQYILTLPSQYILTLSSQYILTLPSQYILTLPSQYILTLPSQYILSLMKFLSHIPEIYTFNCTVCGINTRNKL